jgi:two-component system nitrogen regulation response regulator GlnG
MARILLIDDDREFSEELSRQLVQAGHEVRWLDFAEEGLNLLVTVPFDLVLVDNKMPRMTGLEFLRELKARDIRVRVIFMTGAYKTDTVIDAIALGALYFTKPVDYDVLLQKLEPILHKALEVSPSLARHVESAKPDDAEDEDDCLIVGPSSAMHDDVVLRIGLLAAVDESVLILGETGTGKGSVARALHQHTRRAAAPFLEVNCAGIPEQLLESALFGHEKGAFSGAVRRQIGKFEQCAGGTLFLDEIGEMTLESQSKLLRVLQDHRFERVGGTETLQADVRVIAATNVDLKSAVAAKRFRNDLYYRLNVFTIHLPPLRLRGDDLPLLVQHFVPRYSRTLRREVREVSAEAMDVLRRHSWPGNIRELQSVLKQALLQAKGTVLLPEFLPPLSAGPANAGSAKEGILPSLRDIIAAVWRNNSGEKPWPVLEEMLECELLRYALSQPHESEDELGKRIGWSKNTVRDRKKKYGLNKPGDATA